MAEAKRERVEVRSRREWRAWLEKNHASSPGVWLVNEKKPSPRHLTPDDVTEEAVCFGCIDGVPRSLDAERSMLYVAPRKPGSAWSKLSKERAERMIAGGSMRPAGAKKIAAAKKDGSWDFLVDVQAGVVPEDLARALKASPKAKAQFDSFPPSSKRIILEWIKGAKKPETRSARVEETVMMAARGLRAHHYRQ